MNTVQKKEKNVNIRFPLTIRQIIGAIIFGLFLGVIIGMTILIFLQANNAKNVKTGRVGYPVWTYRGKTIDTQLIPTITPSQVILYGKASYYSRAGCIGCSPTLTMANGNPLDDNGMTVAYNRAPLGTTLLIKNEESGQSAKAIVTDRGGFERHGKIIDLTIAVRDALGCKSTCYVSITHLKGGE